MSAETLTKPLPVPSLQHHAHRKWIFPALVTLVVVGGGGWWAWQATHPRDNSMAGLITDTVKRGDLLETVSATGSVSAQTGAQVKIGSQITGRIKKLNADVGSQVKAGQLIAELDLPDIQAQLDQAKANLAGAQTKQAQQQSGVAMQQTQTASAILLARAGRISALAKLRSAQAAANLQLAQTPTDIDRAENAVAGALAALSTEKSNLAQIQAGTDLQVANAQQQVNQAQATAVNSDLNLKRMQALLEKGYVATGLVDQAQATATVNKSLILGTQQNLILVQQKNTADLQAGRNLITQAEQNVKTARSALVAAQAGTFLDAVKKADIGDARAVLRQGEANLTLAQGNTAQNVLKQQDVRQAQEAVRASQQQVAYAQAQMNKTFIRSPISGTVLQLAAQQGETLAAGLSSPTLIVVADLNRLQVDAYVDETDIGKVKIGQSVTVTVDAFPDKQFVGRVAKIASGSTIQVGVITYDVTIALDNPEHQLKPDMTASVTIQTGKRTGVLLVPSESVKIGTDGLTVNLVSVRGGKAATEARKVTTGGTDGVNTEILTGLKEGETVVLAGMIKTGAARKSTSAFGTGAGAAAEATTMNLLESLSVALGGLTSNKMRTALTMLGVIIGVGVVILVVAIGQGATKSVVDSVNALGTNILTITPSPSHIRINAATVQGITDVPNRLTLADATLISHSFTKSILAVAPQVRGSVQIVLGSTNATTNLTGSTTDYPFVSNSSTSTGRFFNTAEIAGSQKVCVVGTTVAEKLTGDATTNLTGQKISINRQQFKVIGMLTAKGVGGPGGDQDDSILVPITTAMRRILNKQFLNSLTVRCLDAQRMVLAQEQISNFLRNRHHLQPPFPANDDFNVRSSTDLMARVQGITGTMTSLLSAVAVISLLVGGIGIMNIMLVSVTERTREIGIRKAIGATPYDIRLQFLIESAILSLVGGLIGIAFGVGGAFLLAKLSGWSTIVSPASVAVSLAVSAGIGIFFGLYPASKAASLHPIDALHYE